MDTDDFLTWQVGEVKITRIQESEESGLAWVLKDAVPENLKTFLEDGAWKPTFPNATKTPTGSSCETAA